MGTDESQQKLTAHFAFSGLSKLKFDFAVKAVVTRGQANFNFWNAAIFMALGLYNLERGFKVLTLRICVLEKIDNLSTKLKNIFETCLADDS